MCSSQRKIPNPFRIVATSLNDLIAQLRHIDISVPPRGSGRTSLHGEIWSICRFLSTYSETDLLGYPILIQKREKPDFQITVNGKCIGIEVTEAVFEDQAMIDSYRSKSGIVEPYMTPVFKSGKGTLKRDRIEKIAAGEYNGGPGWYGDAGKQSWLQGIEICMRTKCLKLETYAHCDQYWLFIYDDLRVPVLDFQDLCKQFSSCYTRTPEYQGFSKVFIEHCDVLMEITNEVHKCQNVLDLWS